MLSGIIKTSNEKNYQVIIVETDNYMQPSLTSIEQFGFDIGKVATEVLIDLINTKTDATELMHRKTLLEPKLFIRESSMRMLKNVKSKI